MTSSNAPAKRIAVAFAALIGLLAATTLLAFQPLGVFNYPLALTIASLKIAIIAEVFMELRAARPVAIAFGCVGFLWLAILWWLSWLDYATRQNFPPHM
jgi:cytochrome c oxidase subunit 4